MDKIDKLTDSETAARLQIASVLAANRGKRHAIVLQNFPDPDAISSALAHQSISTAFGIDTDILYDGRISHPQNIALIRLLDINLIRFEGQLEKDYDGAILVDNQGTTAEPILQALEAANVPVLVVVDHHEEQERVDAAFSDIRSVGATATIYACYLQAGLLKLEPTCKEHVQVATALMHGILTDTNGFIQATEPDFQAAAFLSHYCDGDLLSQIMNQARSKKTMEVIQKALEERLLVENFSIAGVGYLRSDDRDVIPQAADFLLTEANVHTAIVYGIVGDGARPEAIVGSMRSSNITINPDVFIKEAFGSDNNGRYYGGGKIAAGGVEIPIGFLSGNHCDNYQELKWRVYDSQIKHKILTKIGARPEKN